VGFLYVGLSSLLQGRFRLSDLARLYKRSFTGDAQSA
jgi:hypothetical protein